MYLLYGIVIRLAKTMDASSSSASGYLRPSPCSQTLSLHVHFELQAKQGTRFISNSQTTLMRDVYTPSPRVCVNIQTGSGNTIIARCLDTGGSFYGNYDVIHFFLHELWWLQDTLKSLIITFI